MHETRLERPRIAWLDLLRGGGISLVVIGHCLSGCALRSWIYNFHVPLLFMLSGYLNQTLHGGSKRIRVRRIWLPYMIWAFLSTLAMFILNKGDYPVTHWLTDIVPVTGFTSWNSALWFLYALFLVDVLKPTWLVEKSRKGALRFAKSCVPLALFALLVAVISVFKPEWRNALAWKNVVFGIACYCIGEAIARFKIIDRLRGKLIFVATLFVAGSCVGLFNGGPSTYACYYGRSIFLLALASICISVSLMAFFERIENRLPDWLALLGRCSLFIMVSHYFALFIVGRLMSWCGMGGIVSQIAEGLTILAAYLINFKLLLKTHLNDKLPDYLGGYAVTCNFERKQSNG